MLITRPSILGSDRWRCWPRGGCPADFDNARIAGRTEPSLPIPLHLCAAIRAKLNFPLCQTASDVPIHFFGC
jgi:hypothetical protein